MRTKQIYGGVLGALVTVSTVASFVGCGSSGSSAAGSGSGASATAGSSGTSGSSGSSGTTGTAGSSGTSGTSGTAGSSSSGDAGTPPSSGMAPAPLPPLVDATACADGSFEMRKIGVQSYAGMDYDVIVAVPCEYVLSYARKGVTYDVDEMPTFYVVHSNFAMPYIPDVMDTVVFTPGDKNLGWANGIDVVATVQKYGSLPYLYHVRPGYDYGFYTNYNDGVGGSYGAFRPTWIFTEDMTTDDVTMAVFDPSLTATWPRHVGGWNPEDINQKIGFGLFVNEKGDVYVPKNIPLGRQTWTTPPQCVVINMTSQPIPVTRTQFPGDESYYMAETFMPGYASISSPGDLYWGHAGTKMIDVAKWDQTAPGNFDKPIGGGCSATGYSVGHTNGFTWPELRDTMRDMTLAGTYPQITKEQLYKVSVYEQKDASSPLVLHGTIGYEWHADVNEWYPTGVGPDLIPLDTTRNTFRISGYLGDPDQRAFIVIENL